MIYGIGVDLVHIGRMEKVVERWGKRFITRVFTTEEIEFCNERAFPPASFAMRFAAKEAALKALGTGWQEGIRWKDVEVVPGDLGKPLLNFHGRAEEIFQASGAKEAHVTITHASEYAMAAVVIESDPGS